jgi:hypothetical protein
MAEAVKSQPILFPHPPFCKLSTISDVAGVHTSADQLLNARAVDHQPSGIASASAQHDRQTSKKNT